MSSPVDFRWSPHWFNSQGKQDVLVASHEVYLELGRRVQH